ncbi:GntR family transcriptional regulator [Salisediminibacterium beveridgei]|uniref:Transcriptional regulator, GntR family n=1 Tax=Salisediminibacterium beveridgei TaxID=632773 RepID=A0A1D7QVK8_9BACI|nr:GntR family transcriptional regulator [Salisediminibacterium beveridgei]AOM83051.1 Transcriptional regulator, GntR family [Salisediminibacterium beveridgei]
MGLEFDNHRPIYIQIMEYIYSGISRGDMSPGSKLLSVREFAVEAGVNPNTVSRTYMEMEREGVVVSKRGQGTFVTEDTAVIETLRRDIAAKQVDTFLDTMHNLGIDDKTILNLMKERMDDAKED